LEEEDEIEYQPISVKELLMNMKNYAWLMVNLAYSSIIYNDETLAAEVLELEKVVDRLDILLNMQAALATRSADDAEKMVSIFRLATATNKISDAAADIAFIVFSKIKVPRDVILSLFESEETITRAIVDKKYDGSRLGNFIRRKNYVIDVIAVRRGKNIFLEPDENFIIRYNDALLLKGNVESIKDFMNSIGLDYSISKKTASDKYREIINDLIQLKNTSLVMVDIAYTAMLTKSEELAERIKEFENYVDVMLEEFSKKIISSEKLSIDEKYGAMRLAIASEEISDAALLMVQPLLAGLEPHPIIVDVVGETFERISVIEMDKEDDGKTLSELGYSKRGIIVLAVRRNDDWIVMPPYSSFVVKDGDVLIVKYISESESIIDELEREEDREEIIEDIQEEEWEEEEED